MTKQRSYEPAEIELSDGVVRKLRFTNASIKRIKTALGLVKFQDIQGADAYDALPVMIFEGLVDKTGLSVEAVNDLIDVRYFKELFEEITVALQGDQPPNVESSQTTVQ